MNIRDRLNDNPGMVALAAVLMIVVAVFVIWHVNRGVAPEPRGIYFYDLDASVTFVASTGDLPPIETPAGGSQGVRIGIYGCGGCPDNLDGMSIEQIEATGAFVAYFERYADQAKASIERARERARAGEPPENDGESMQRTGLLVRHPDASVWLERDSDNAMHLTDEAPAAHCGPGTRPHRCLP